MLYSSLHSMEDEGGEPLRQLVRKYDEKECVHVESEGKGEILSHCLLLFLSSLTL